MQPSIPLGTVLQDRYRITKILGQGGFGRTYLAEDRGRFNELCALKELIPAQTGYALEKSKELFQREAAILYQIQHPQIPQFRATFEQDQRLFLVQDYVEGKTYRTLQDERQAAGQTFSEAEVLQMLRQLLPVLAHIHSRGIVHRDISPENIILRDRDHLPVLIDFGVVKELATRLQSSSETVQQTTTVGKYGYAPSEQLQAGRAYPSSDLYSLAVTSVVLLTGREPQELFDDKYLSWNWQRWAQVSPGLALVLNRMLSYKPDDRYQSVAEVAQALQALTSSTNLQPRPPLPAIPGPVPTQQVAPNPYPSTPGQSQMETMAVGRRPDPIESGTTGTPSTANRRNAVIPSPADSSIWDNPWAIAATGTVVALVAGMTSWAIVSYLRAQHSPVASSPQQFPSPLISQSPTPTSTASSTPSPNSTEPVTYSQHLNLTPGRTTSLSGNLKANATVDYIFSGQQGQQLSATLAQEGVLLTVLAPNQQPVDEDAQRVPRYRGTLPFTGEYDIQLGPVQGVAQSKYRLSLRLASVQPSPTPVPTLTPTTPTETLTPTPEATTTPVSETPISFAPGQTATRVSGVTGPQQVQRYLVNVQKGQEVAVAVQKGKVLLNVHDPDGQMVENASKLLEWQGQVTKSGDYQIDVIPDQDQDTNFTLNISARNLQ